MTERALTAIQEKMLTGPFYIDGWHNRDYLPEANDLVRRGLLTVSEGGDSQHTSYHYQPVSESPS